MSKYEGLKYWSRVKARVPHRCQRCGAQIGRGELYYKEKIDFVRPPPGLMFDELCENVAKKPRVKLSTRLSGRENRREDQPYRFVEDTISSFLSPLLPRAKVLLKSPPLHYRPMKPKPVLKLYASLCNIHQP